MKVLGIETSCDETAVAIVEDGKKILSNVIASQSDLHALYGGVVPELASRRHSELMHPVIEEALRLGGLQLSEIDLIAATHTPGLLGALLVGLQSGKSLALGLNIPFIGVHHVEAHLYSAWMSSSYESLEPLLPALGLVVSGGHTLLVRIDQIGQYELLAHSLDDALGEAFDKVAVMLGLPYPGGPQVEKLALRGDPTRYPFKAATSKKFPFHFSYSGLKTQVLYAIWGANLAGLNSSKAKAELSEEKKADLSASFQHTVIEELKVKLAHWIEVSDARSLWLGGGVSANQSLRRELSNSLSLPLLYPSQALCVDNAAMIAGLGYHQYKAKPHAFVNSEWDLPALPRSPILSWL